nr:MAG TPA: hypothetical protein [Microviridae sp.]
MGLHFEEGEILARKKIRVRGHRFSDAPAMYMKRFGFTLRRR